MQHYGDFSEALSRLQDALMDVRDSMPYEIREALHGGGKINGHWPPYSLRNFRSHLEGAEGGWMMTPGDSFREAVDTLAEMVAGEYRNEEDLEDE